MLTSSPRRARTAAALTLVACGLGAGPASAAITSSAVTSPASGTLVLYDYDLDHPFGQPAVNAPANQLTIAGATTGAAPGDKVDVGCQSIEIATPSWKAIANDVAVAANGSFTVSVGKDAVPYDQTCTIRAIPGATADAARATLPVTAFTGPATTPAYFQTYPTTPAGRLRDHYASRTQAKGFFDYLSASSCGVDFSRVITGSVMSAYLFNCNDYFTANFNSARNGVQVDGARAFLPDDVPQNTVKAGAPGLAVTRSIDPATGDLTIVERDDVVRCNVPADPLAPDQCPSYSPSGLRLQRTITQTREGRQTTLADEWISTDGAAHRLDAIAEEDFAGGRPAFKASWEDQAYVERDQGDILGAPPASAPGTVFVDGEVLQPDTGPAYPQGAVTYASNPVAFSFGNDDYYYVRYLKTVPAGGKTDIVQVYSQGETQPEVQGMAAEATARFTPPPVPGPKPVVQTVAVPGATPPAQVIQVPTPQCVIPKLTGLTTAKAKTALTRAKCAVGKTRKKTTRTKSKVGKVLSASKQLGGAWKVGTKVDLTIGKRAAARKKAKR